MTRKKQTPIKFQVAQLFVLIIQTAKSPQQMDALIAKHNPWLHSARDPKKYVDQPGDSAELKDEKRRNRRFQFNTIMNDLRRSAEEHRDKLLEEAEQAETKGMAENAAALRKAAESIVVPPTLPDYLKYDTRGQTRGVGRDKYSELFGKLFG